MLPVWLIEADVYGGEAEPLLAEIRRQGMPAEIVHHRMLRKGETVAVAGRTLSDGDCVIGYGTFPFARQIQLHRDWRPGAWATAVNLDCTTYFAHFHKFLLNQRYSILPGVEAIREQDRLFELFGKDDEVFARPTSCNKFFTGRCIFKDDFALALSSTRFDPATMVVVAAPREIDREWRLVISGDNVITGSQYGVLGSRCIEPGYPVQIQRFAEEMLAEVRWRPDPIFMLDICEAEEQFWLVEINGFSCSWLYACDLKSIVAEASRVAIDCWKRGTGA
jgi:ATP-grasp domain-containing protein